MYEQLASFDPERVCILQGNRDMLERLAQEVHARISLCEVVDVARFTIEHAKSIVSFNEERAHGSWVIAYFDVFVSDAAEVLLKTLEEPRDGIVIVFVTPHPYLLPQTIRSRARVILNSQAYQNTTLVRSHKELSVFVKERFGDDSVDPSIRRAQAVEFLDMLEAEVRADISKAKVVYEGKQLLFKANMPTKQVMEYVVAMLY